MEYGESRTSSSFHVQPVNVEPFVDSHSGVMGAGRIFLEAE
jgi:hypothetical protein